MIRRMGAAAALMAMVASGAQADAPGAAKATLRQALGAISQAEGVKARELIGSINLADLSPEDKVVAGCVSVRLDLPSDVAPPAVGITYQASRAYRDYWLDAAMGRKSVDQAEETLRVALVDVLGLKENAGWDGVEAALEAAVKKQGYGVLLGRTGRLRELMVWTSERTETRDVTLPEGTFNVRVTYLDSFASMGWSRFLSCDRIGTGGWAKPDGLYAVVPAYPSLDHELFRLSFLGHETQHFSDYKRFPGLKPWELEYRAKLVELTYAETISPMLLRGFASAIGTDPEDSHAYANGRVIAELKARLKVEDLTALPVTAIQRTAREALLDDSKARPAARP